MSIRLDTKDPWETKDLHWSEQFCSLPFFVCLFFISSRSFFLFPPFFFFFIFLFLFILSILSVFHSINSVSLLCFSFCLTFFFLSFCLMPSHCKGLSSVLISFLSVMLVLPDSFSASPHFLSFCPVFLMLVSCTHTLHPSIVWCAYFPGFSLCRGNWILSMLVMRACLRINRWLNKHFTSYCLPSTTLWAYLALLSLLSFLPCPSLTLFSFIALSPALVPPLSHFPSH